MKGEICKTCGIPISKGAFLELCAACSEDKVSKVTAAVTSRGNAYESFMVLGIVVALSFLLYFFAFYNTNTNTSPDVAMDRAGEGPGR